MERNASMTHRDAAIEARLRTLPVNEAHRDMAIENFRHGIASADRAYELIGKLRVAIGAFRAITTERGRHLV